MSDERIVAFLVALALVLMYVALAGAAGWLLFRALS